MFHFAILGPESKENHGKTVVFIVTKEEAEPIRFWLWASLYANPHLIRCFFSLLCPLLGGSPNSQQSIWPPCPPSYDPVCVKTWVMFNQPFLNSFSQKFFNSCVPFSAVSQTVSSSILPYSCATTFHIPRIACQRISPDAPSWTLRIAY